MTPHVHPVEPAATLKMELGSAPTVIQALPAPRDPPRARIAILATSLQVEHRNAQTASLGRRRSITSARTVLQEALALLVQTSAMHRVLKEPTVKQERQSAAIAKQGSLPLSEPPFVSHAKLASFPSPALGLVPNATLERKVLAVLGLAIAALLDTPLHKGRQVVSSALLVVTLKLKLELA